MWRTSLKESPPIPRRTSFMSDGMGLMTNKLLSRTCVVPSPCYYEGSTSPKYQQLCVSQGSVTNLTAVPGRSLAPILIFGTDVSQRTVEPKGYLDTVWLGDCNRERRTLSSGEAMDRSWSARRSRTAKNAATTVHAVTGAKDSKMKRDLQGINLGVHGAWGSLLENLHCEIICRGTVPSYARR